MQNMILPDINKQSDEFQNAHKGCNICFNCGENKPFYMHDGKMGGILLVSESSNIKGFFRIKCYQQDHYVCETCGASWSSDWYRDYETEEIGKVFRE